VIPFLLKVYVKRLSRKFEKQAEQATRSKKEKGSVTIDHIPDNKTVKEAPGDYVDFEEIDKK
jgi:hypothetical protein